MSSQTDFDPDIETNVYVVNQEAAKELAGKLGKAALVIPDKE